MRLGGRNFPLVGLEGKFAKLAHLVLEDQKTKFLQSATELFAYADLLTCSTYSATASLSSEVERLKRELATTVDSLKRKEAEIDTAKAEHVCSQVEADSARSRLEEDKRMLTLALELANKEKLGL